MKTISIGIDGAIRCLENELEELESYIEKQEFYAIKNSKFIEISRSCWCIEEMVRELDKNRDMKDPLEVMDRFRKKVDDFCCIAKTEQAKEMFVHLYECVMCFLDYLLNFTIV